MVAADTPVVEGPVPAPRTAISNKDGLQTVRSGQTVEDTFFDAILASYANMSHSPLALLLMFTVIAELISMFFTTQGPFQYLTMELKSVVSDESVNKFIRAMARPVYWFFSNVVVPYNLAFINVSMLSIPTVCKPSTKNIYLTILFSFIVVIFSKIGALEIFIFTQFYFLYTELRNPKHKLIIILLVFAVFLTGYLAGPNPSIGTDSNASGSSSSTNGRPPNTSNRNLNTGNKSGSG